MPWRTPRQMLISAYMRTGDGDRVILGNVTTMLTLQRRHHFSRAIHAGYRPIFIPRFQPYFTLHLAALNNCLH